MIRRKGGRTLPLGHKPRGLQRVRFAHSQPTPAGATSRVRNGPTAQQSVAGTQVSTTPGIFSSAAGGSGYRTLEAPPLARAPVQPRSLGFFTPFALRAPAFERAPAVPFAAPQAQTPASSPARSTVFAAPVQHGAVIAPSPFQTTVRSTPQRSTVFAPPPF